MFSIQIMLLKKLLDLKYSQVKELTAMVQQKCYTNQQRNLWSKKSTKTSDRAAQPNHGLSQLCGEQLGSYFIHNCVRDSDSKLAHQEQTEPGHIITCHKVSRVTVLCRSLTNIYKNLRVIILFQTQRPPLIFYVQGILRCM